MNVHERTDISSPAIGLSPRRVLLTVDTVGGVWTYGIDLANALSKEGVEVMLAAIGPSIDDAQVWEAKAIRGLRFEFREARLEWMQDPWEDVEATRLWLAQLEQNFQPDIAHLNQYCYTLAFQSPTLVVGHSCVYSWFSAVKQSCPGEEWESYRRQVGEGLSRASGVSGVSEPLLDELEKWYGSFRRLPAVRNGRSLGAIEAGDKDYFILSAGRVWDEAKNFVLLDSIAPQLSWPIRIAGNAEPTRGASGQRIQNLELLGHLEKEKMEQAYAAAPIYAAPALYEPFGLAILEAAAAGCALVLADIGSLRSIWEGAAIFISPRCPQAWANALAQLSEDEPMRQHLGELASQRARTGGFSPARMGKAYSKIYGELLNASLATESNKIA